MASHKLMRNKEQRRVAWVLPTREPNKQKFQIQFILTLPENTLRLLFVSVMPQSDLDEQVVNHLHTNTLSQVSHLFSSDPIGLEGKESPSRFFEGELGRASKAGGYSHYVKNMEETTKRRWQVTHIKDKNGLWNKKNGQELCYEKGRC